MQTKAKNTIKKILSKASTVKPSAKKSATGAVKKSKTVDGKLIKSLAKPLLGKPVPQFKTAGTSGTVCDSKLLKGQNFVLYFYPKDNTPGCTLEGLDFGRLLSKFKYANCKVFGVSKDSMKSHENFKTKFQFPFELLLDESEEICKNFDVIQMKKLYGREYRGIERSTFLVDEKGIVRGEWRHVRVKGHALDVLTTLQALQS